MDATNRVSCVTSVTAVITLLTVGAAALSAEPPCPAREKIVFMHADPSSENVLATGEIYIMNPDGSEPLWLTADEFGDFMPALSRDGKGKILFDSNRRAIELGAPATSTNSDLFLMNADGTSDSDTPALPILITRGSSASWEPGGKRIAFHRARSGGYGPRIFGRGEPGGPTRESDIFVVDLDDLIEHGEEPRNLTASLGNTAEDDADWSPVGGRIAFTSRSSTCTSIVDCQTKAEIWVMNADGTDAHAITSNTQEERSPDWSPDGSKIVFMCRLVTRPSFEICAMNPDGSGVEVLTNNTLPDLSPSWSPDGTKIAIQRFSGGNEQIYVMDYAADESGSRNETAVTTTPMNLFPNWSTIAVGCGNQ